MKLLFVLLFCSIANCYAIAQENVHCLLLNETPHYLFRISKINNKRNLDSVTLTIAFVNKMGIALGYSYFNSFVDYESNDTGKKVHSFMDFEVGDVHLSDRIVQMKDTFYREIKLDSNFNILRYKLRLYNYDSLVGTLRGAGKEINGSGGSFYAVFDVPKVYESDYIYFEITLENLFEQQPFISQINIENKLYDNKIQNAK